MEPGSVPELAENVLVRVGGGVDSAAVEWVARTVGAGDILPGSVGAVVVADAAEEDADGPGVLAARVLLCPAPVRVEVKRAAEVRAVPAGSVVSVLCGVELEGLLWVWVSEVVTAVRVEVLCVMVIRGPVLPREEAGRPVLARGGRYVLSDNVAEDVGVCVTLRLVGGDEGAAEDVLSVEWLLESGNLAVL